MENLVNRVRARVKVKAAAWQTHQSRPRNERVVESRYVIKLTSLSANLSLGRYCRLACMLGFGPRDRPEQYSKLLTGDLVLSARPVITDRRADIRYHRGEKATQQASTGSLSRTPNRVYQTT